MEVGVVMRINIIMHGYDQVNFMLENCKLSWGCSSELWLAWSMETIEGTAVERGGSKPP